MTPEDQKHYENYFELFASDGWKQIVEMAETEKEQYTISNLEGLDQLRYAQGMISVLDNIINFEDIIRRNYDKIIEDEAEEEMEQ